MTTTVIIKAHCATTKEVRAKITDGETVVEEFSAQDGETAERTIYDGRKIEVHEAVKS